MNVAIIPARGGSKRIPGKNIRLFNGLPMIAWSINAIKSSQLFDRIVVSTDSDEIAKVAREFGAEVPFIRPPELADDFTPTIPVISHAISELRDAQGYRINNVCCVYATAPFIRAEDLIGAYQQLNTGSWEYCFSVTEYEASVYRSFRRLADGGVEMLYPEQFSTRSQDLPATFHDAGQFYWGTIDSWTQGKPFFSPNSYGYSIPRWLVQDIDTEDDWYQAELMMGAIQQRS